MAWRHGPTPDPGRRSTVRRGATCARTSRSTPGAAPVWHAQADSAACRLWSTEAPDARASLALEALPPGLPLAVSAGHTHPSASSRAEQRIRDAARLHRREPVHASRSRSSGAPRATRVTLSPTSEALPCRCQSCLRLRWLPRSGCSSRCSPHHHRRRRRRSYCPCRPGRQLRLRRRRLRRPTRVPRQASAHLRPCRRRPGRCHPRRCARRRRSGRRNRRYRPRRRITHSPRRRRRRQRSGASTRRDG